MKSERIGFGLLRMREEETGWRRPLDALMVGARIEELDIAYLRQRLTRTTDPQVRQVNGRLMQGLQKHLRAFAT